LLRRPAKSRLSLGVRKWAGM